MINIGSGSVDGLIILMDCETWWDGMRIVEWALWSFYDPQDGIWNWTNICLMSGDIQGVPAISTHF